MIAEIEHLLGNLEPFVHEYGAAAVMVILTFESLGLPLPGESVLVLASVLAGRGELSLPLLMLAAWAGAVMGDNIGYLIGRRLGRILIIRYGVEDWHNRRSPFPSGSGLRAIWFCHRRFRKVRQCPASVERRRGGHVENGLAALSLFQRARRRPLGFGMDTDRVLSWCARLRHQSGCP